MSILWNVLLFIVVVAAFFCLLEWIGTLLGIVIGWFVLAGVAIWKLIAAAGARVMALQHKRLVAAVAAVVVGIVCVYTLSGRRYTVTRIANGAAYQIDNITGRAWILIGDQRKLVSEKD